MAGPGRPLPASLSRSINYTVMLDERVIGFAQWYSEAETIICLPASISSSIGQYMGAGSVWRPYGPVRRMPRRRSVA